MALNPSSPGVYIEEIALLPGSIAGVATAIPAFIGYVEKAERNGVGIPYNTPVRITSLLEYETIFGKSEGQVFNIEINDNTLVNPVQRTITVTKSSTESKYKLYYNIVMYFANGGGPCWIVPIGLYSTQTSPDKDNLLAGLAAIAKVDEPTLLVFPDAVSLSLIAESKEVYDAALAQCELLKDRFTIMDLPNSGNPNTDAINFRNNGIGPDNLKYGAAYYPNLSTTMNFGINSNLLHVSAQMENGVPVTDSGAMINFLDLLEVAGNTVKSGFANAAIVTTTLSTEFILSPFGADITTDVSAATAAYTSPVSTYLSALAISTAVSNLNTSLSNFTTANGNYDSSPIQSNATLLISAYKDLIAKINTLRAAIYGTGSGTLSSLTQFVIGSVTGLGLLNPSVSSQISSQINTYFITLNPSGSMAGIYARVDRERGVWKAPANAGVRSIVGPSINVTTSQQDGLNVDATSGKSINVIRAFTGRGTLVWGGRTLAGNDNEWRYVNVRRLFIYVEESIQEATEFVVFESNTATTWSRVKGMIDSFLTGLWKDGALAGATTEEAFFVRVGIGTTMTPQDVLEGRMIVEIGLAAVRPAEFIILKFMHKLQES